MAGAMEAFGRAKQGPSAAEMAVLIGALAAKVTAQNAAAKAYNTLRAWLPLSSYYMGPSPKKLVDLRDVAPLNHARVVDDLLMIHGHEILVDGCFNGVNNKNERTNE